MQDFNLSEDQSSEFDSGSINEVSPKDRLSLAKNILMGIFALAVLSIGIRVLSDSKHTGAIEVFEAAKTILPAIATLVIGYYFGKNEGNWQG